MSYQSKTIVHKTLSDTNTPVELYLKLRDKFANTFLLESSEHLTKENSYSYLCLEPIASFVADTASVTVKYPDGKTTVVETSSLSISEQLNAFANSFAQEPLDLGFMTNGLFGYTAYDAAGLFNSSGLKSTNFDLALMQYHLFRFQIVFNHFNNELFILEHLPHGDESRIESIKDIVLHRAVTQYHFSSDDDETSNFTDNGFLEAIQSSVGKCESGATIHLHLSRKYQQKFTGDEFNVYRALRSVNPSSYLFYFDYGNFKIFGSSPEAQLTIKNRTAVIHPIAGTVKRSGDFQQDEQAAQRLMSDPQQKAEHSLFVDLAINDLGKNSSNVVVESYMQAEYYSQVIQLASKVVAELETDYNPIRIFGDSFPAGTLSGFPKENAMQIIDHNEKGSRGFFGGSVGMIGLDGSFNHAIFVRSFLSRNNQLTYQAGCGISAASSAENQIEEVNEKLSALRGAIALANTI